MGFIQFKRWTEGKPQNETHWAFFFPVHRRAPSLGPGQLSVKTAQGFARNSSHSCLYRLGPPAIGALSRCLFWGGSPYENRQKQVATLILTSLLEDLGNGSP